MLICRQKEEEEENELTANNKYEDEMEKQRKRRTQESGRTNYNYSNNPVVRIGKNVTIYPYSVNSSSSGSGFWSSDVTAVSGRRPQEPVGAYDLRGVEQPQKEDGKEEVVGTVLVSQMEDSLSLFSYSSAGAASNAKAVMMT